MVYSSTVYISEMFIVCSLRKTIQLENSTLARSRCSTFLFLNCVVRNYINPASTISSSRILQTSLVIFSGDMSTVNYKIENRQFL